MDAMGTKSDLKQHAEAWRFASERLAERLVEFQGRTDYASLIHPMMAQIELAAAVCKGYEHAAKSGAAHRTEN